MTKADWIIAIIALAIGFMAGWQLGGMLVRVFTASAEYTDYSNHAVTVNDYSGNYGFSPRVNNYLSLWGKIGSTPTPAPGIPVRVSFYSSSPEEGTGRTTSSGQPVSRGVIAVNRDQLEQLPFGTPGKIEGLGDVVVQDVCGACQENWIDAWVPTRSEAFKRGILYSTMTITRGEK